MLAATALIVVLAACGTTTAESPASPTPVPSSPAAPSDAPSEAPSEAPVEETETDGTITIVSGGAVDGPGGSISDALANPMTEPVLVNGALFMDADGNLFFAESLTDAAAPTFGGPILRVVDYPAGGAEWDLDNAEVTGLQEANGVLFFESMQLYGVVES